MLVINYSLVNKITLSFILAFLVLSASVTAGPSGGPYGPVNTTYEIPRDANRIYFAAPDGNPESNGRAFNRPTTVENAIKVAETDDVIVLRGGIYRTGGLVINQGITIQPYQDELPVFKGTLEGKEWVNLGNGLWTTKWEYLFPEEPEGWWRRELEGKNTPLHKFNNDMVFIDGRFLQSAGWEGEVNENTFYIDYKNKTLYIGTDPTGKLVEITAFNSAIERVTGVVNDKKSDKKGFTLKGLTFTQYAYRAIEVYGTNPEGLSNEENHGKDVVGTTIENCTISYCSRVAAYLRGDNLILKNCKISDTSTEGIFILSSSDVLLEKNIFMRNNIEQITGYYPAAVKIFNQCYRVTCNDNLIIDHPYSHGIWYDVGNVDGVFTNNWVENVGNKETVFNPESLWPGENGFFFEISKGVVCAGNVFVNCDNGLMILNSSDAQIYNNTFVNSTARIGRTERSAEGDHFGWHPATGPGVNERDGHIILNNIFAGDKNYNRPLLFVWQPAELCDSVNNSQLSELNNNYYVKSDIKSPLILWGPAANSRCQVVIKSLTDLNKLYPEFCIKSKFISGDINSVLKSYELKNFIPIRKLNILSGEVPIEIQRMINKGQKVNYTGAFAY